MLSKSTESDLQSDDQKLFFEVPLSLPNKAGSGKYMIRIIILVSVFWPTKPPSFI
jgi:hypothetical protein